MLLIKRCAVLMLISSLLLLMGCTLKTGNQNSSVANESAQERKARKLFAQGAYHESASLYQRLANKPSARQNTLRLQAAQALLKLSLDNRAKNYLDLLALEKLTSAQSNELYLMYGQLDLNAGNFEMALGHLRRVAIPSLRRTQKSKYYAMTAFAYALTGELINSIHERIARDSYLKTAEERKANNLAIFELLSLVSEQTLLAQQKQSNTFDYAGWLSLELARRKFTRTEQRAQAVNEWGKKYPRHPAQALITSGYFLTSGFKLVDISRIAVFLPESGPYSAHAKALRAGFIAAYNQPNQVGLRPDIRFYDTEHVDISLLYSQAVADGAQLIIGPLNKKYIKELVTHVDLVVPVMALNYVEGLTKTNLYQFALSPLDEVQQAVRQARNSDYENAIIIAPESVNGLRISHYFQNAWEAMNGNILEVQTFRPGTKDFSAPVRKVLNINESQHRFQQLQKVLPGIEYQPRRRQDVEVIFLVGDMQQARLLNPQFYHNRAESVTTYGLAKIYNGLADKNRNMDLEGMRFCTIPWLFDKAYQGEMSQAALNNIRQQFPEKYFGLIAFGVDAYAVVKHLNDLASVPYPGATGDLLLNEYNRIERHLVCAEFKNGKAALIEMDEDRYKSTGNQPVFSFNP